MQKTLTGSVAFISSKAKVSFARRGGNGCGRTDNISFMPLKSLKILLMQNK